MLRKILTLLADGQFHTAEKIAQQLGITPRQVKKTLLLVLDPSLQLQIVRGRGFRIPNGIELLDQTILNSVIGEEAGISLRHLEILDKIDSTNTYLLTRTELPKGSVCLAEQQSAGRGRHGRRWISPFGRNLYLSLCWHFTGGASQLTGLSLVVGVAIINALQAYGINGLGLKWPNDVMFAKRKLGGILLEIAGNTDGFCRVIIGVGINIYLPQTEIEIDQPWIDIFSIIGKKPERNRLIGLIIKELLLALPLFQEHGLAAFWEKWHSLDILLDQKITIKTASGVEQGIGAGIDDLGHLLIKQNNVLRRFNSGEVSVRL